MAAKSLSRPTLASNAITHVVLGVAVVLVVFPLLWIVLTSFKTNVQATSYPPNFGGFHPTTESYETMLTASRFRRDLLTSLVITAAATALAVAAASLAAYTLVRLPAPGKRTLMLLIVLVQVVPGIILVIPLYKIATTLHLYDSWLLLILVYAAMCVPFATWVLVAFIKAVPVEIEEAALIDGASRLQIMWRIVLPVVAPGMATAAMFSGIASWNQFLFPLILGQESAEPLTVYMTTFATSRGTNWGALCAAAVVILTPIVVFVTAQQRHLVRGLMMGSVK